MIPQEIIAKKRDKLALDEAEIEFFIRGCLDGSFKDYQATALLMAILLNGMSRAETVSLTRAMLYSGDVLELPEVTRPKVDKHSTGGVGDKVSLILSPLVAAVGLSVPMISGRGLGHTGGTLDKLEAIPGFRTALSETEYRRQVATIHQAIISQTETVVPADRLLYALRDVTATVESIPLIVASILSKKLAEGIDALVLDVKVGRGAFMKTIDDARALAQALVTVGKGMGKSTSALITRMDEPLGRCVGNALEVVETIQCLRGEGPDDLMEVTYALAVEMLKQGGLCADDDTAMKRLRGAIEDGSALAAFKELVEAQGGDGAVMDDPTRLPQAAETYPLYADDSAIGATILRVEADRVGEAARLLGAGRAYAGAPLDLAVGISDLMKVGERIEKGRPIARIHHGGDAEKLTQARSRLLSAFAWGKDPVTRPNTIVEYIR